MLDHYSTMPDSDIIFKFLYLLKEKYKAANDANYFLERQGISGMNIAITNQRDVLSHLITCLDPTISREEKESQLYTAEEHLRRAIIEPYQYSVSVKKKKLEDMLQKYNDTVIPLQQNTKYSHFFSSAPKMDVIEIEIEDINNLCDRGRDGKRRNLWDAQWESGVKDYLFALSKTMSLIKTLEDQFPKAHQIISFRKQRKTAITGICIGIVIAVISFAWEDILTIFP